MTKLCARLALLGAASGCATLAAPPPGPVAHQVEREGSYGLPFEEIDVVTGVRVFDDDGFDPHESVGLIGLDFAQGAGLGNLWLEGGIHYSFDSQSDVVIAGTKFDLGADTLELSAGLLYGAWIGRLRPFVGAGASYLFVDIDRVDQGVVVQDGDSVPGAYGKVGLLLAVSDRAHVGIEYRHFEGSDLSLGGVDLDSRSDTLALVFGTSF